MTVRDFRQLRELEVKMILPNSIYTVLFSSITSIELRKIILLTTSINYWGNFRWGVKGWTFVDEQLCGLVDSLRVMGYSHTLEVELRLPDIRVDPGGHLTMVLPKFKEKGVVTMTRITTLGLPMAIGSPLFRS